jgi:hypothetical protein
MAIVAAIVTLTMILAGLITWWSIPHVVRIVRHDAVATWLNKQCCSGVVLGVSFGGQVPAVTCRWEGLA